MYPHSAFPRGSTSFRRPVTPVLVDPQDEPTVAFKLNSAWLPVLRGAIQQLCLPSTWDTHTDAEQQLILGRAQDLLALFDDTGVSVANFDVRQDVETPCILEKSEDGGLTWSPFANTALCAPLVRVRPKIVDGVTGEVTQTSEDGGATWQDVPGSFFDPKTDGVTVPAWTTVPTGQDGKCLTAFNIAAVLQRVIDVTDANFDGPLLILKAIEALTGVLLPFVPLDAGLELIGAIAIGIGSSIQADFDAALNSATVTKFRCIVFKHDTFNGTITPFQYSEIVADVTAQFTGLAQRFILNWMAALGPVGLTNASGAAGIASGDCSDCVETWCATWDAAHSWEHWQGFVQGGSIPLQTNGVWNSAHTNGNYEGLILLADNLALPAGTAVTEVSWTGSSTDSNPASIGLNIVDGNNVTLDKRGTGPANPNTVDDTGLNVTVGPLTLYIENNGPTGQSTTVTSCTVKGTGPIPDWANPC